MCGFLLRRTRDPHLAEDLAQETFVRATRALLGWRDALDRLPERHRKLLTLVYFEGFSLV